MEVRLDSLTGSASRVRHPGGTLTGPGRQAPTTIARGFLATNRPLFQLSGEDITALQPVRQYASPELGTTHLTLQPVHRGIPVLRSEVKFDLKSTGELLTVAGAAVPQLAGTVNTVTPRLTAGQGLLAAAKAVGVEGPALQAAVPSVAFTETGSRRKTVFAANTLYEQGPVVQLSYVPVRRGETRLAWETTLRRRDGTDVFNVAVDALSGELLLKSNCTNHLEGTVFDQEAPENTTPYLGGIPPLLERAVKPFDGAEFFPPADSHRDWWAGAPVSNLTGNNTGTFVQRDRKVQVTPSGGSFTFPLDLTQNPVAGQQAAAANLFYWVNRCHDIWYSFGFDEASGNFQKLNFGLGGVAGDSVSAAAQYAADGSPRIANDATFTTFPDGQAGVLQMTEWSYANPLRDGALAADLIVHEYGHGVTQRLIGDTHGLWGFQSSAMGEGLSDFQSLVVLAQPTDDLTRPHPLYGWVINNYPAGVRSQPYSANRTAFDRTYGDIGQLAPDGFPEIHLAGEIICNALFQAYGRFVSRLGFAEGRTRAMQLFIDACKLAPHHPTFLDFRDALLLADQQRYGGADTSDLWTAFAAHGMGVYAYSAGVDDRAPAEDFTLPGGGGLPVAPTGFHVTRNGDQLTCSWRDNSNNETGFRLERSKNNESFQELAEPVIAANANSVTFPLGYVRPEDLLVYRVRSFNLRGTSLPSNKDTIGIHDQLYPIAPTDFSAVLVGPNRIDCTWTDTSDDEDGFSIYASFQGDYPQAIPGLNIPKNSTFMALEVTASIPPGTLLFLDVRSYRGGLKSDPSNGSHVEFPAAPPFLPPTNFSAVQQGKMALCSWKDNSTSEAGFALLRSVNRGPFEVLKKPKIKANVTSVQVPLGISKPGDQVTYRVRADNPAGTDLVSNAATIVLPLAPVPSPPSNFTATLRGTLVKCAWKDNAQDEQGFRLEQSVNGEAFTELPAPVIKANKKKANLTLSGVSPGDVVTLRVRAFNANGSSPPSNPASVTVPGAAPSSHPSAGSTDDSFGVAPHRRIPLRALGLEPLVGGAPHE